VTTFSQACNELFLQSRREDPTVRNREHALQSLYLAYNKYREITHNLDEGIKVISVTFSPRIGT
jgi:hypothetical protein